MSKVYPLFRSDRLWLWRSLSFVASGKRYRLISIGVLTAMTGCAGGPDRIERQDEIARDPAAMMRIAQAAEKGGDWSGAAAFYGRAADLSPDLAAAQIGGARALASHGDVDQAISKLEAAHTRNPADAEIAGALGQLLVAKDPNSALAVYDDGLRAEPRSSFLLVGRGVALDALDRHPEAQAAYRMALEVNPASEPARKNLALSQTLERRPVKTSRENRSSGGHRSVPQDARSQD